MVHLEISLTTKVGRAKYFFGIFFIPLIVTIVPGEYLFNFSKEYLMIGWSFLIAPFSIWRLNDIGLPRWLALLGLPVFLGGIWIFIAYLFALFLMIIPGRGTSEIEKGKRDIVLRNAMGAFVGAGFAAAILIVNSRFLDRFFCEEYQDGLCGVLGFIFFLPLVAAVGALLGVLIPMTIRDMLARRKK